MKSDNAFYITLALIGIFGIIAIVLLKDKSKQSLGSLEDDYVKKSEIDDYVTLCIAKRNKVQHPLDLGTSTTLIRKLPSNTLYEGKEF